MTQTNTLPIQPTILETHSSKSKEFKLSDLKNAIPEDLFQGSLSKSIFYFVFDSLVIVSLLSIALYLDSWLFYPVYWFLQGTFFGHFLLWDTIVVTDLFQNTNG